MVYSIGIKELWEVPAGRLPKGAVLHTMGAPLDARTFGGGFIYGFTDTLVSVGLVVGLDYHDPFLDPHALFQKYKEHPLLAGDPRGRQDGRATARGRSARAGTTRSRGPMPTACSWWGRRRAT